MPIAAWVWSDGIAAAPKAEVESAPKAGVESAPKADVAAPKAEAVNADVCVPSFGKCTYNLQCCSYRCYTFWWSPEGYCLLYF